MKSLKQLGMLSAVALMAMGTTASAHTTEALHDAHCNFIPKNNLRIPVGFESTGGLSEDAFNQVIDHVESFYKPMVKAKGGKLKIKRLWTNDTLNASAQRQGRNWIVNMYGGLARHPLMTEDGYTLVLCHELGHHLGGFPRGESIFGSSWASVEGQADYHATMKCSRIVWQNEDNAKVLSTMNVPEIVKDKCALQHKSTSEIQLCERASMAGKVLADVLWSLANEKSTTPTGLEGMAGKAKPSFDTPDSSQVSTTDAAHPAAQCRLDTYFNGAICGVSYTEEFGAKDPVTGACAEEKGDTLGVRPRCWYKPSSNAMQF